MRWSARNADGAAHFLAVRVLRPLHQDGDTDGEPVGGREFLDVLLAESAVDTVADLDAGAERADLDHDAVLIDGNDPGRGAPDRETFVREVGGELVQLLRYWLAGVSHGIYPQSVQSHGMVWSSVDSLNRTPCSVICVRIW